MDADAADLPSPVGHPFLEHHCLDCHDDVTARGGLNLADLAFDAADPVSLSKWAKVHDRMAAGEMPPAREARPDPAALDGFIRLTATALDGAWADRYRTLGRVGGRRLNPVEYEYTVRDLLAAPWLQLKEMLPPDPEAHGFDNVAAAQEISYVQLARYLDAAEVAIDGAMRLRPAPTPTKVRTWFNEEGRYLGKDWKERYGDVDGRPEWTWFMAQPNNAQAPRRLRNTSQRVPGWYKFRVRCRAALWDQGKPLPPEEGQVAWINTAAKRILGAFDVPGGEAGGVVEFTAWQNDDETLEFFCATMDDRLVSRRPKGSDENPKLQQDAHRKAMQTYRGHGIAVDWFEIEGPFADEACDGPPGRQEWPSESYCQLFDDLPMKAWTEASGLRPPEPLNLPDLTANKDGLRDAFQLPPDMLMVVSADPRRDAERLLRRFMPRAYRRPVEESEVQRCLKFAVAAIDDRACFQDAMRLAYKAVLCSPDFLYLRESPGVLDGDALACRLSYLLWRSMPDAELTAAARSGALAADAGLRQQFARMLRDPKAARFVSNFTGQWLDTDKVYDTTPDKVLFPEYFCDTLVVESGVAETEATFAELLRENRPARAIVAADFVMVNERLAELYGIPGVKGNAIRRVAVPAGSPRGGFLTQSSVLKVTANGLSTSPVLRGVWVMDRVLGTPPSPPPPGAGAIEPDTRGAKTIRELLDKHRRSASCANCHAAIDPPGFALESFDVMGKARDYYRSLGQGENVSDVVALRKVQYKRGLPVDASGETQDGHQFKTYLEFRDYLAGRDDQLARNLVGRFLTFATGAGVSFADRAAVDAVLRDTRADGYPIRSLLERVVLSDTFRRK